MILKTIVISIGILAVFAAGIFYWQNGRGPQDASHSGGAPSSGVFSDKPSEATSVGAQVFLRSSNPLKDEIPETNPFREDSNPLKDIYKNPF